jgi:class 3 adenylate cyclase
MTRLFDAHIIVGEDTFREVRDVVQCRELGRLRLKGIRPRQTLYEVCGVREPVATLAST